MTAPLAMDLVSGVLTLGALGTGIRAAILCWRASQVPIDPGWSALDRPVLPELEQLGWNVAFMQAASVTGNLNGRAVYWTVGSVILSAMAGLVGLSAALLG